MSTRLRWGMSVVSLVLAALLMAWLVIEAVLVGPASRELLSARAEQVRAAARAIEGGIPLEQVEGELGIDLRLDAGTSEGPPRPPGGGPHRGDGGWTPLARGVWQREGGREVAAWTGARWVVLHEDRLLSGPVLLLVLLLGGLPVGLIGLGWTGRELSPVVAAERALARVTAGELDHRLDETAGPGELRRMATAINALTAQVERLVHGERMRLAGLSHELRTPLTRARLELELARRAGGDGARIGRVERELEQLDGLVAELLELSRLEIGRGVLRCEEVDLRGLMESLVDDEAEQGVQISGAGTGWVDPRLVRRAVGNLLRNARQHAPGAARRVDVGDGRVTVSDDGPGLTPEDQARVFELFWRAPGRTTEGHGLGLALVRQIVSLHGGEVTLDGRRGLTVTLRFP